MKKTNSTIQNKIKENLINNGTSLEITDDKKLKQGRPRKKRLVSDALEIKRIRNSFAIPTDAKYTKYISYDYTNEKGRVVSRVEVQNEKGDIISGIERIHRTKEKNIVIVPPVIEPQRFPTIISITLALGAMIFTYAYYFTK